MTADISHLRALLQNVFPNAEIQVIDESYLHAGHADARPGEMTHVQVTVVSDVFSDLSLPDRHRLVYRALEPLMAGVLHAVKIRALTPAESEKKSHP